MRCLDININIILCDADWSIPYFIGCTILAIEPLNFRRSDLCIRFAQKTSCNPMHSDFFTPDNCKIDTRQDKPLYREFNCTNNRYYDSPLCYLTRLLNKNPVKGCSEKTWVLSYIYETLQHITPVRSGQWTLDLATCIAIARITLGCFVLCFTTLYFSRCAINTPNINYIPPTPGFRVNLKFKKKPLVPW